MKIIFIGHPGSGKTYVSELASNKLGVEKVDIDVILDNGLFDFLLKVISKKAYRKSFSKLFEGKKEWIIDGYHGLRMPDYVWQEADYIVFIDLPKSELRHNIINRYRLKKSVKESTHNQASIINNLKNFYQIYILDGSLRRNVKRVNVIINNDKKLITVRSRDELNDLIHKLTA